MTANQGGNILKKTIGLWSGILLVSTVLVGCVSATELPDKKEKIVIDYMANMVLEHDANIDYEIESIPVITLPPKVTVPPSVTTKPPEESASPNQDSNQGTNKPEVTAKPNDNTTDNPSVIIGVSGIDVKVKGYEIRDNYSLSDSFVLEPKEGTKLMMVYFSLKNNSEMDKNVKLTAQMVDYEIVVNEKDKYNPLMTALDNDFLYLDTDIEAGNVEEAVLVFQVNEDVKIESVGITMKTEKEKYEQLVNKLG